MDLNFVGPPLEPGMVPYRVDPLPSQAADRLRDIAREARETEKLTDEAGESVARAMERPEAVEIYAENAPFIGRFLTIELNTTHKIAKGIGRIIPADPPPRFGDKFKRALQKEDTRSAVVPLIDRYIFQGFAMAAGSQGLRDEDITIEQGEEVEIRWGRFMRGLFATYGAFTKEPDESAEAGLRNIICYPLDEAWEEVVGSLAGSMRQVKRARARTYTQYFPAVGWSAYFASSPE
jgi:hypothetical protein